MTRERVPAGALQYRFVRDVPDREVSETSLETSPETSGDVSGDMGHSRGGRKHEGSLRGDEDDAGDRRKRRRVLPSFAFEKSKTPKRNETKRKRMHRAASSQGRKVSSPGRSFSTRGAQMCFPFVLGLSQFQSSPDVARRAADDRAVGSRPRRRVPPDPFRGTRRGGRRRVGGRR